MASVEIKLFSRIVLRVAVFISLSVLTSAEGARRCYWCGPLAEQVHRSQRAPPCGDTNTHLTVCDPGFPHCAVVATSPPYVESRYCVKFYQDECYSLYCNSTKTWRMTCPCRGDLCNGPNTEREHDAFTTLVKLVAKHARIKRALVKSTGFMNTSIKSEIKNNSNDEMETNIEENLLATIVDNVTDLSTASANTNKTNENTNQATQNLTNDEMQSDQPADNIEAVNFKTKTYDLTKSTIESMIIDVNNISVTETLIQATTIEITPQSENKDTVPTKSTKLNRDVIKLADKEKTSNPMPTVEAHQNGQTPAVKFNYTIMDPTMMSTRKDSLSAESSMRANNTATHMDTHLITQGTYVITIAIAIILQY